MRPITRKVGTGIVLLAAGLALLLAGGALSLGHLATEAGSPATEGRLDQERAGGLAADLQVRLTGLGLSQETPALRVAPAGAEALPLPGFTFDRDVTVERAGVKLQADLDVRTGSHRALATTGEAGSSVQGQQAVLVPIAAPVALAAAAFTVAGLAAYFWTGLKTWAFRLLVFPLVPLYARVTRAQVFDNGVRERIFQAVKETPGIAATDLSRKANVSWGTTMYHLDVLEQTRMVTSMREGRHRRYFENGAQLAATKEVVALLQNPVTAGIAQTIRDRPGATQKELAAATGMSPQALHWHLARLVGAGVVKKEREGRVVRHFAS